MATLDLGTFNTGSVTLTDLRDAVALAWGYTDTIPDPENPGGTLPNVTKAVFVRQNVARLLKEAYRQGKRMQIMAQAETTVPDITIT